MRIGPAGAARQRDALGEGLAPEEGRGVACAVSAGLGDGLADAASRPRWSSASRPDALAENDALEELGELDDGSTGFWVARKLRTRCSGCLLYTSPSPRDS